ncbi:hypothetical protein EDB86DRAFT_3013816, partial [Lactarius hatsudake]
MDLDLEEAVLGAMAPTRTFEGSDCDAVPTARTESESEPDTDDVLSERLNAASDIHGPCCSQLAFFSFHFRSSSGPDIFHSPSSIATTCAPIYSPEDKPTTGAYTPQPGPTRSRGWNSPLAKAKCTRIYLGATRAHCIDGRTAHHQKSHQGRRAEDGPPATTTFSFLVSARGPIARNVHRRSPAPYHAHQERIDVCASPRTNISAGQVRGTAFSGQHVQALIGARCWSTPVWSTPADIACRQQWHNRAAGFYYCQWSDAAGRWR